ncbi:hypothetical protein RHSIM_Rhsim01G0222700 [Rhododendron simsii]|uniref:Cytochrome P450 n=1 Tax=Rhododendron simsii TaxID=118357 RepID=A0A834LWM7_RHOSS|nr:hypothetical protein RHSIM_Rhsim01G0222700 [Rhododendron simsii]
MDFLPLLEATGILLALLLFYNLWWLKTYTNKYAPEPKGAWPIIGHLHLLGGKTPVFRTLAAMADKHGPIFTIRLGLRCALVVSSKETIMECFTTKDRAFLTCPKSAALKYLGYDGAMSALGPHGPYWRELRVRYGLDDDEKDEEVRLFTRAMDQFMYLTGAFEFSDVIPGIEWMDLQGHVRLMKQNAEVMDSFMSRWLEEHVQSKKNGQMKEEHDFMDVLLSLFPEDDVKYGHKCRNIVKGVSQSLIMGGSDTTTAAMTWALSLLLNHKKSLQLVQQELDTRVGRERWVEESDIKNLDYLQASVKETLRLYPPGPLSIPREAMEDCHVAGYFVPKGTRLIVNLWKLHHDSRVWTDPHEFRPERFLDTNGEEDGTGREFAFLPFSWGRRSCPGMTAAYQVMHLTLGRLLQGFNVVTRMDEAVDMSEGLELTLPKATPLEVLLSPRLKCELYMQ